MAADSWEYGSDAVLCRKTRGASSGGGAQTRLPFSGDPGREPADQFIEINLPRCGRHDKVINRLVIGYFKAIAAAINQQLGQPPGTRAPFLSFFLVQNIPGSGAAPRCGLAAGPAPTKEKARPVTGAGPSRRNIPPISRTGSPGDVARGRDQGPAPHHHLMIFATTPAPTVRPPSRMAKRSFSSIAIGAISSTSNFRLSPGITISVPSGSLTVPVTSVVRK